MTTKLSTVALASISAGVAAAAVQATIPGAKFTKKTQFVHTPTQMSLAMAAAGIIPGTHLKTERANIALLRHKNDNRNQRRSVRVGF